MGRLIDLKEIVEVPNTESYTPEASRIDRRISLRCLP
jgi:hypothetical protein